MFARWRYAPIQYMCYSLLIWFVGSWVKLTNYNKSPRNVVLCSLCLRADDTIMWKLFRYYYISAYLYYIYVHLCTCMNIYFKINSWCTPSFILSFQRLSNNCFCIHLTHLIHLAHLIYLTHLKRLTNLIRLTPLMQLK